MVGVAADSEPIPGTLGVWWEYILLRCCVTHFGLDVSSVCSCSLFMPPQLNG